MVEPTCCKVFIKAIGVATKKIERVGFDKRKTVTHDAVGSFCRSLKPLATR